MLGTLSGELQQRLPDVAQRMVSAGMAQNVLERTSKFSEMRALLKSLPANHTAAVLRQAFGDFGLGLLALDVASPLFYGESDEVLTFDVGGDSGELFIVRRKQRAFAKCVYDLVLERSVNGGPPTLLHILHAAHRSTNCCARLRALKEGDAYLFWVVVGAWRYRIDHRGTVFKSSVVPRNRHLRLPRRLDSFLHDAAQQNRGANLMLKTMPEGDRAQPYQMVARDIEGHQQVNIYVEPRNTKVRGGRQHILYPFYRICPFDGTVTTLEIFRGQALYRPNALRLHIINRRGFDDKWRLHQAARLGNHLFYSFRCTGDVVEGVVRLPECIYCIREITLVDKGHIMYCCCHDQRHIPVRPEDEYGGDPTQKSCLPVTVLAPVTKCDVHAVFESLRQTFIKNPAMNDDEQLAAIDAAAPCAMHPRLAFPGFFSSHAEFGGFTATQFGGALLVAKSLASCGGNKDKNGA